MESSRRIDAEESQGGIVSKLSWTEFMNREEDFVERNEHFF